MTLDIASMAERIRNVGIQARNEEDVKIGVEKILGEVSAELQLKPAYYEFTIVHGRADALYGRVIIEYETPYYLKSKKIEKSKNL